MQYNIQGCVWIKLLNIFTFYIKVYFAPRVTNFHGIQSTVLFGNLWNCKCMCGILWLNFSLIIGPYFLSIFRPCRYRIGAEDFAVKLYILTLNTSSILRLCDNLSYKFKYVEVIKFLFKIIVYNILRSKKVNAIVFHVKHHSDVKIHFCTNKWTKVLLDKSAGGQQLT
jgi:hypothetical protein